MFVMAVLMLVGAGAASAQVLSAPRPEQLRRGFIGIGIGPSMPFGTFAADTLTARGGRATPGYIDTFLNIAYRFRDRWGMAVAASYGEYVMRDGGDDDWWQVAALTAGPLYSHPIGTRAALDLKLLIGWISGTPVIDSYSTIHGIGHGTSAEFRTAVRYDVFRKWAVFAEVGAQSGSVSFRTGRRTTIGNLISGVGVAYRPQW